MSNTEVHWLSEAALARLTAHLEDLKGPRWDEVVDRVSRARDEGDLKENGGYHAAREEQGKLDGEIKELTALLENVVTDVPDGQTNSVVPGTLVGIQWGGTGSGEASLIADRRMGDFLDIEVYSPQTPMVAALLGRKVGEVAEYEAPNGRTMRVSVDSIEPFTPELESEHLLD